MPSQDENLDNLLRDVEDSGSMNIGEKDEKIDFSEAEIKEFTEPDSSIGVSDIVRLSKEDIDRLLSENGESVKEELSSDEEENNNDLMDLLSREQDDNLQEIHDLLQKADNNEAISDDIVALLQDNPDEEIVLWNEMNETMEKEKNVLDARSQRLAEKKREKEARKADKMARKEAQKTAKLEAKAARDAEKKAKREAGKKKLSKDELPPDKELLNSEFESAELQGSSGEEVQQIFDEMDMSGLDAFFADADAMSGDFAPKKEPVNRAEGDLNEESSAVLVEKMVEEKQPKKKVFSRILDFLTEEVEEDVVKNNENIQLSDENKNIIEQLDKEKKKKEKKNKKQEKPKKEKQPKKEKKPKKEKTVKDTDEDSTKQSGPRLKFKQVFPMLLRWISVAVIIILVANIAADYSAKRAAKEAYYNGDYEICYQNLFGKDLNESEQIMYSKSECILRTRLWIREYEMLAQEGAEAEALDSLIQSVDDYPILHEYAMQWNAESDTEEAYAKILNILSEKYHLTEAQAKEIAHTRSDIDYSKKIYTIIDGGEYGSWNQPSYEAALNRTEGLEDVLQEEEELGDTSFVDNNH